MAMQVLVHADGSFDLDYNGLKLSPGQRVGVTGNI